MELQLERALAVFDLETTGTKVASDRIVEISILKINADQSQKNYTKRINPGIPISEEATKIHGISNEDVANEPSFKDLAKEIKSFIGNADLAGYNASRFDIPLLVEEFLRADVDFEMKDRRIVDVMNIYHKMEPRTLSAAYKYYCGQELEDAHSAEADTLATYEILKNQIKMYEGIEYTDKFGKKSIPVKNDMQALHQFSQQNKFADLAGQIIFNEKNKEVFNFGKYKGKLVEDIFTKEPQYYDWIMRSDFPLYTKKILTAIKMKSAGNLTINFK
jgi:DNA polymerase-3 subunit epsilon